MIKKTGFKGWKFIMASVPADGSAGTVVAYRKQTYDYNHRSV